MRPTHTYTLPWALAVCGVLLLSPAVPASASEAGKSSKPRTVPAADARALRDQAKQTLTHGSVEEARTTLKQLAALHGDHEAAQIVADALIGGMPEGLLEQGLSTLGALGDATVADTLTVFTRHRRVPARLAALQALVTLDAPGTIGQLQAALGDSDPRVRGYSARTLGNLLKPPQPGPRGPRKPAARPDEDARREATEILFVALGRGVPEAARAIGQIGAAGVIPRYGTFLERAPLPVMLAGYKAFLDREDLTEADKVAIIVRLEEVASAPVKRFLQTHLVSTDWRAEPTVKRAIEAAVRRIAGDQPANPSTPSSGTSSPDKAGTP